MGRESQVSVYASIFVFGRFNLAFRACVALGLNVGFRIRRFRSRIQAAKPANIMAIRILVGFDSTQEQVVMASAWLSCLEGLN